MHFRVLLIIIVMWFYRGDQEFTAKKMTAVTLPPEGFAGLVAKDYNFHLMQETKRISNNLGRLYKMGFLKRRITDRQNVVVKGRPRKLGKEYIYRISKQGEQYVMYLLDQKEMRARLKKEIDR